MKRINAMNLNRKFRGSEAKGPAVSPPLKPPTPETGTPFDEAGKRAAT
jgi:hypothetical protein